MIWLLKPDHPKTTEFAPAMDDSTGILPGLPSVMGKPVHVAFDGGQMTSDAGILLLAAVEQQLKNYERLRALVDEWVGLNIERARLHRAARQGSKYSPKPATSRVQRRTASRK